MITNVSILGSTGSIGTQTLDVVKEHPDFLCPLGLSAGLNHELLLNQSDEYKPNLISIKNEKDALLLKKKLKRKKVDVLWGEEGNIAVATLPQTNRVVISTPGFPGIRPTIEAIKKKKTIAIATKEVLVAAGSVVTREAKKNNTKILPVDSEHSAIFQCIEGRPVSDISRIFITCSGGPFRGMNARQLNNVTLKQALSHPSWKMGKKITIDSSTLMNKGFEVIEAHWLFGIPYEKIKVIVHPQSVIHSAVEFIDGTIIAQIGPADMRLPIQYALFHPENRKTNSFKRFSFDDYPNISFEHPDKKTFRCLDLAYQAGRKDQTYPAVLNAANDIAVEAFLAEKITFSKIAQVIEKTLEMHKPLLSPNLEEILEVDGWAREYATSLISKS